MPAIYISNVVDILKQFQRYGDSNYMHQLIADFAEDILQVAKKKDLFSFLSKVLVGLFKQIIIKLLVCYNNRMVLQLIK